MKPHNAYCSFCRKSHTDVGPLVEGPEEMYICGECIELCQSILDQERRRRDRPRQPLGPALLRKKLDQLVGGYDQAKEALALAAGSRNEGGGRVLLVGPSSSAKILLARALAYALDAPFAAGDLNSLVRCKQGSMDVSPLIFSLLQASDFDVEAAQRGVVFVDGAERQDTQFALVRLWQEKPEAIEEPLVAIHGILFVCGGTFFGLDESIARLSRHSEQPITVEGLTAVSMHPDWASCLAGIARVAPLDEGSLVRMMHWIDFPPFDATSAESGAAAGSGRGPGF